MRRHRDHADLTRRPDPGVGAAPSRSRRRPRCPGWWPSRRPRTASTNAHPHQSQSRARARRCTTPTLAQAQGFDGTGVTVASSRLASPASPRRKRAAGSPTAINVLNAGNGDEGTAMLKIVQDMAPRRQPPLSTPPARGRGQPRQRPQQPGGQRRGRDHRGHRLRRRARLPGRPPTSHRTGENIAAGGVLGCTPRPATQGARHKRPAWSANGNGQRPGTTRPTSRPGVPINPYNVVDIDTRRRHRTSTSPLRPPTPRRPTTP